MRNPIATKENTVATKVKKDYTRDCRNTVLYVKEKLKS